MRRFRVPWAPRASAPALRVVRAALLLMACALAACTALDRAPAARDLRTASDSSDADRLAQVRLELAAAYFARGQTLVALDEVKQALAARPDLASAHELRGLIYAQLGEAALAEQSFQRALQLAPRSADAMHNYAWFLCQQRRDPEAQAWFARALSQPGYRDGARTLLAQGVCQARVGRLSEARVTLARAAELDPDNLATAYPLAEVMFLLGDDTGAQLQLRRLHTDTALASPASLWLAAKVERRRGDAVAQQHWGRLLVERFPGSAQAQWYQGGRFNE